ncbi:hypothetical protein KQH54_02225 [bacterium]|nr:hypothetical protein [bacterium]
MEISKEKLLKKYVYLATALLVIVPIQQIVSLQSEAASSLLWGLSVSRLILVFGLLLVGLVFLGMAVYGDRLMEKIPRLSEVSTNQVKARFSYIIIGAILLFWLGFGDHAFEDWQEFYIRLRPVIQYFAFVFSLWTIYYFVNRKRTVDSPNKTNSKIWREVFIPFGIFGLFLLVWGFIRGTGIGITPGYPYWGEAGTILFGYQFVLALVSAFLLTLIFRKLYKNHPKGFDAVVFVLLWVAAGVFWNLADIGHNFFAPQAFGQTYYPYSDAAIYDVNAYSILIGKGISFAQYTYRPMYIGFLALLHFFSGPDYGILVGIQVAILALFVPGLYLVGRELHSRTLGLLVAFMGGVAQLNSFVANEFVRVSNVKLLLTEFPTAVILVFTAFFFISGIKRESQKRVIIAFGLLAIGFLIRLHVAVVLVALLVVMYAIFPKMKVQLRNAVSILGITFLIVFPWMLRNYLAVGHFSLNPGRFTMLLDERWKDDQEGLEGNLFDFSITSKIYKPVLPSAQESNNDLAIGMDAIQEIIAHFFHNEVLSVMGLPDSFGFLTGRNYYQNEYFLTGQWDGELSNSGKVYVAANLLILSIGIWSAYRKEGFLGLAPLVIHLSYNGANALVRTSGWRYLTPTDWVMILYYGLGLLQIFLILRDFAVPTMDAEQKEAIIKPKMTGFKMGNMLMGGVGFVMLSAVVSFAPMLIPDQFPQVTGNERLSYLEEIADGSDISVEQMETFLSSDRAVLLVGKVLYPRYYYADEGIFHYRSEVVGYPRAEFTLIDDAARTVRLSISRSKNGLEQDMDVVILGCRSISGKIDAVIVYPMNGDGEDMMLRNTGWESTCPLPIP